MRQIFLFLLSSIIFLQGCATVPPLAGATNNFPFSGSIPIHDIVQRVKCDLSAALYEKLYLGVDKEKLKWMTQWTAKADLTLEVNESGGITPNVSYMQPLHNAFFFGAGPSSINTATGAITNTAAATAQNFTFGISGTYNAAVTRTETLSFTISLAELRDWRVARGKKIRAGKLPENDTCEPTAPIDLQSGLDLKPWLDEALKPVIGDDLRPGIHPDPGSVKASTPAGAPPQKPAASQTLITDFVKPPAIRLTLDQKLQRDFQLAQDLSELGIKSDPNALRTDARPGEVVCNGTLSPDKKEAVTLQSPVFDSSNSLQKQTLSSAQDAHSSVDATSTNHVLDDQTIKTIKKADSEARKQAIEVQKSTAFATQVILDQCSININYVKSSCSTTMSGYAVPALSPFFCEKNKYDDYLASIEGYLATARTNMIGAQNNAALAKRLLTPDPPIESIGQSLDFVVTLGLNGSPNWSLLHWKGPGSGSSFGSLNGIRTHTLNIALGAPSAAGVTEVSRVLNNEALRQAVQGLAAAQ